MSKPLPKIPKTAPVERVTHILSHENRQFSWIWARQI